VSLPDESNIGAGSLALNDMPGRESGRPQDMSMSSQLDELDSRKKRTPAGAVRGLPQPGIGVAREGANSAAIRDLNHLSTKHPRISSGSHIVSGDSAIQKEAAVPGMGTGPGGKPQAGGGASSASFFQGPLLSSPLYAHSPETTNVNKLLTPATVVSPYYPAVRQGAPVLNSDLTVPVTVQINEFGEVRSAALARPDPSVPRYYADEAVNAARAWRFSPARINGKAVPSEMEIGIHFRRPDSSTP
jgi:TonB family protein